MKEELSYFAQCILDHTKPEVILPAESMEAVKAYLAAEELIRKNSIIQIESL